MAIAEAPAVLTVTELCTRWKCTRNTVLDAIKDGRLRAFNLGVRAYRVSLLEVERFERGDPNDGTAVPESQ